MDRVHTREEASFNHERSFRERREAFFSAKEAPFFAKEQSFRTRTREAARQSPVRGRVFEDSGAVRGGCAAEVGIESKGRL